MCSLTTTTALSQSDGGQHRVIRFETTAARNLDYIQTSSNKKRLNKTDDFSTAAHLVMEGLMLCKKRRLTCSDGYSSDTV